MPNDAMSYEGRKPDVLRFTIALKRTDEVNYSASDYYRNQFSTTLQENFEPEEAYVGYDYRYELRFEEFIRETSRAEWRFELTSCDGFDRLGLRVVAEGYRLVIGGRPTRAFTGLIEVVVLPGTTASVDSGSFQIVRNFKIADRSSFWPSTASAHVRPHHVEVIRSIRDGRSIPVTAATPGVVEPAESSAPEWKDVEPPQDAPFQTSNSESVGAQICFNSSPLAVLGASQRGRSHAHEGKFREDAFGMAINRESTVFSKSPEFGWHIFVVSDGAGSAKYSRRGSRLICEVVTKELSELLNRDEVYGVQTTEVVRSQIADRYRVNDLRLGQSVQERLLEENLLYKGFSKALSLAYGAIRSEAERLKGAGEKVSLADFSATALCVAMKRFGSRKGDDAPALAPTWAIASYWVGDGALALYRPNYSCARFEDARNNLTNDVLLLGRPDAGEYAGETRFLTSKGELDSGDAEVIFANVRKRMSLAFLRNFEALFMATDGVTDPFFEVEKRLTEFDSWQEFWTGKFARYFPGVLDANRTPQERAQALLDGMMFKERGHHDDRTALLAVNDEIVELERRRRNSSTRFEDHPYFRRGM